MLKEAELQKQCVTWLKLQHPELYYFHPAQEGKRSVKYWAWLKSLGASPGVPDLLIFNKIGKFGGLAIELKAGKGKLTENQVLWLERLRRCDWFVECVNSFEDFCAVVDRYCKGML